METEFEVLPFVLLALISILLGHSFTSKSLRSVSVIGIIAIFLAIGLSISFSMDEIRTEGLLFNIQVACFLTFLMSIVLVLLNTACLLFNQANLETRESRCMSKLTNKNLKNSGIKAGR